MSLQLWRGNVHKFKNQHVRQSNQDRYAGLLFERQIGVSLRRIFRENLIFIALTVERGDPQRDRCVAGWRVERLSGSKSHRLR